MVTRAQDLTWDEAIKIVLERADGALHYADIAAEVSAQKLRRAVGANPAAIVATRLSRSLSDETSPFLRVGKGEYTIKGKTVPKSIDTSGSQVSDDDESATGALRAFGMYWQRSQVLWTGRPKLLGRQQLGASDVNFAEQVGVYLLHDRERIIYVGRASDTLHARLKAHTTDRMGGRWDRFSWFGLRSVDADGDLREPTIAWTHGVVIETMEALLIESLEPPLNRKRGDNFSGSSIFRFPIPTSKPYGRSKSLVN